VLSFITATDDTDLTPVITNDIPNVVPVGVHTFTVTATDASGNSSNCPLNITVQDTTPPTITAPADVTKPVEAVETLVSAAELGTPVVIDIVDDDVLVENDAPSVGFLVRDTIVTWTATDASGNSAVVTQLVTIEDSTPPEITNVPDNTVIEAINGYGNVINYDLPQATDLGGLKTDVECSLQSGTELPIGPTTVICSVMDNALLTQYEMFLVIVDSSDDDGDGITNIVDPDPDPSNEYSDVSLGGITSGEILTSGDQTLHVIDGDDALDGVIIMTESGGLGINEDFDCQDSDGNILRGLPDDGEEDGCFDSAGNLLPGNTELIDEDIEDGIDNDGDGFIDEDFGVAVGPNSAQISSCNDSALVFLSEGQAVSITCGSITIEAISGSIEIEFTTGGPPATTTLSAGGSLTFDPDTLQITAGPDTDAVIFVGGFEFVLEPGQTIQLDVEPPELTVPADITQEVEGPEGAVVEFEVTATDNLDPAPAVVCLPASGFTFPYVPPGPTETIVECTATDFIGNSAEATFTITIDDTTPPTLQISDDITVEADDPFGSIVEFIVTASDLVDTEPQISCSQESGTLFPIGTTSVECTSTDNSDNESAPQLFDVTVTVSSKTFDGLIEKIESLGLQKGIENSLISKLNASLKAFEKGNDKTTTNILEAFINEVNAQDGKKLSGNNADILRDAANLLINSL